MSERVINDPTVAGWEFDPDTGYWMWVGASEIPDGGGLWNLEGNGSISRDSDVYITSSLNFKADISAGANNPNADIGINSGKLYLRAGFANGAQIELDPADGGSTSFRNNITATGNATFSGTVSASGAVSSGGETFVWSNGIYRNAGTYRQGLQFFENLVAPSGAGNSLTNGQADLGSASYKFKDALFSGTVSAGKFVSVNSNGYSSGIMSSRGNGTDLALIPIDASGGVANGTVSLGRTKVDNATSLAQFKNAYFSGTVSAGDVNVSTNKIWRAGFSGFQFTDSIRPVGSDGVQNDGVLSIGTSDQRFKNAYFSGTVNASNIDLRGNSSPIVIEKGVAGSEGLGNISIHYKTNTQAYYTGVSADLKFQISTTQNLGVGKLLSIDASGNATFSGTVTDGTGRLMSSRHLIETLSTLRTATQDEKTFEGLRDSISNAIGGLIEKFEAMQTTSTQEISDE